MSRPLTVGVIAGEASGSALGTGLIRALRARAPEIRVIGIGAQDMADAGAELWYPARVLSVMGLAEVVRHLPRLLRVRRAVRRRLLAEQPDVFVGIDLPDFNLSVARWLRRRGIPAVQYVSPSVWAWRERRLARIASAVDEVLCLLPFEARYYDDHGVRARFVGHPLADSIDAAQPREPARAALGLSPQRRYVAVLPGSRASEIATLGPVFGAVMQRLRRDDANLEFLLPVAEPSLREPLAECMSRHAGDAPVHLLEGRAHTAMAAADTVMLASGTAALEAMLIGRPMVVAYRLAALTSFLVRHVVPVRIKHFSLPNLLAGEALVPELLQDALTVDALYAAVRAQLEDPTGNAAMLSRFDQLRALLANNASECAAQAVLEHAGWERA